MYNPYGKYAIKLFIDGAFRKVVVDDIMPVDELGRPLLTITTRKEFWPALLAKAILKALYLKCPCAGNIIPNNMSVGKNDISSNSKLTRTDARDNNINTTHSSSSSSGAAAINNKTYTDSASTIFDSNKLAILDSLRLFYDSPEQLGMYLVGNLIPSYITALHDRVEFVRYLIQSQQQ